MLRDATTMRVLFRHGLLATCAVLAAACSGGGGTADAIDVAPDPCAPVGCAISPCVQNELTSPAPVLAEDGSLATIGWSRRPILEYDPGRIPAELREQVKNWDFYSVQSPAFYLEVTVAELSLFSFTGVTVLDYATGEKLSGWDLGDSTMVRLPTSPYAEAGWEHEDNRISVTFDGDLRVLSFVLPGKFGGIDVSGEVRFEDGPSRESLAVAHPLPDPGTFFYEDKIFGMRTSGWVKAGTREVAFDRQDAYGVLDWGRGVWPRESQWFWGAGYGTAGGHDVAFNLGAGLDAIQRASADGILVDGVIHKIGSFAGSTWQMDPEDPMKPWVIRSPDGRVDLTLTPHTFAPTRTELGDYYMHGLKVYGDYEGKLVLDDCTVVEIRGFAGFAEQSTQRW